MSVFYRMAIHMTITVLLSTNLVHGSKLKGDIDGNENLTLADTITALQVVSGDDTAQQIAPLANADVNSDGKIGTAEAIYTLNALLWSWSAQYYDNKDLTGLIFMQQEQEIRYNWGASAPAPGLPADGFSVRWTGTFDFAGTYTFTARSDDGIRVLLDGEVIMDHWHNQPATTHTLNKYVSGEKTVTVEYYENSGGAVAEFHWSEIQPSCEDGVLNQDETAIDCGGSCPPCPVDADGDGAYSDVDCDDDNPSIYPGAEDICENGIDEDCNGSDTSCTNTCENGVLDYGEYWIDCGGECGSCPTCVDGVKNGDEQGIDCGGTCLSCDAVGNGQLIDVEDDPDYPYNFRIHLPPGYTAGGSYPLLLFLHGAGERGDNLNEMSFNGPLKHVNDSWWNYDFIIIAPQVKTNQWWNATRVHQLYQQAITEYAIDPERVYVTGLSMGGYGTAAIMQSNNNQWVAANAEICGVVATDNNACKYSDTASWSFTCDNDPTVTAAWRIVDWAKILHGENEQISCGNSAPNANIKISMFDCDVHNSWTRVYDPFRAQNNYILSESRDVNPYHQFQYGNVNNAPPLYDWFLHNRKQQTE